MPYPAEAQALRDHFEEIIIRSMDRGGIYSATSSRNRNIWRVYWICTGRRACENGFHSLSRLLRNIGRKRLNDLSLGMLAVIAAFCKLSGTKYAEAVHCLGNAIWDPERPDHEFRIRDFEKAMERYVPPRTDGPVTMVIVGDREGLDGGTQEESRAMESLMPTDGPNDEVVDAESDSSSEEDNSDSEDEDIEFEDVMVEGEAEQPSFQLKDEEEEEGIPPGVDAEDTCSRHGSEFQVHLLRT